MAGNRARLLVVTHQSVVARDLQDRLRGLGHDVPQVAASVATGTAVANQVRPDLVLMDVQLCGEGEDVDTAEDLRRRFGCPVVYLTAGADPVRANRTEIAQAFGCVVKPFQPRELQTVIETALYKHAAERQLRLAQAELGVARAELERQLRELHARDRLVQAQMRGLGGVEARRLILEVVASAIDVAEGVFYDVDEAACRLRRRAPEPARATRPPRRLAHPTAGGPRPLGQPRLRRRPAPVGAAGDACAVPLMYGDAALGVVWVRATAERPLRAEDPYTLWRLCQQAAVLLRMACANDETPDDGDP